jgi:alpha-galactosidase
MPRKIAVIGAGSVGFTRGIVRDTLCVPELQDTHFAFQDINAHNLDMVYQLVKRDIESAGLPATVSATTDRREALTGAKYVYSFVRVGGLEAFETDIEIPLKYGVDQCVGDTLAPGGIMYAQRTIPVLLDICKDISEVAAEGALFLNYSNPMAMNSWACNKYGHGVRVVGLCHGVEGGHRQIAEALGLSVEEVDIICAGINHQTWYIQVRHKGEDLTGKLLAAFENHPEFRETEKVRIDMLRRFGYYSTESNGHLSEYLPWYRKRPEEIMQWIDLRSWILGETGGYLRICLEGRRWFEHDFPRWREEPPFTFRPEDRGTEHGSYIVESLETGRIYRGHFNVVNHGRITNLPDDCMIEAPGYVDGNGLSVPYVGDLPLGCAAVCNASVTVQRLGVEAAVHGDDTLLRQALLLDPLTGAVCNPPEVWQMADELLVAQAEWLPQYGPAIATAQGRLSKGNLLPTRDWPGAARLPVRSLEELELEAEQQRARAGESDKAK